MDQKFLFIACVGGAIMLVAYFLAARFTRRDDRLSQRLGLTSPDSGGPREVGAFLRRMGDVAAQPFMPKDFKAQSAMRRELARAGIYTPSAIRLVIGFKMIGIVIGIVAGYFVGSMVENYPMSMSIGGLIGYLSPKFWMRRRIKTHQKDLTQSLPDALDLLVVCVEAGLTVDSAMQRVGMELNHSHPAISRELGMTHMETRVGLARAEALKNLGLRTGNAAIQSLSSMLIQAERFGTSIASALRIHADSLRTDRRQAAEEMAAKASVKLSFPLVMFILPATFIVMAGPFIIGLAKSELLK